MPVSSALVSLRKSNEPHRWCVLSHMPTDEIHQAHDGYRNGYGIDVCMVRMYTTSDDTSISLLTGR
eukprot:754857-Heterocapsa_arctica.AAC.1